ncbi:pantoate--beta-alanine ligase [Nakamurella flava]|uniref:Pantothenate synthetase n=1 Tax=Nakamurella flava TaxID=2576308 RepID=A0A4U6QJR5_9ACTN|nr:pantoate--beta-alanine ligase [Nakamurella flava]TKV60727.1 pantoate--beta-alanine ligase [Nakamurella flava]
MITVRTVADLRAALGRERAAGRPVALVPTMGALHDGHLTLARRAAQDRAGNEPRPLVVMSIFVNPIQFNDAGDLAAYPRDEAADAELAAGAGVDILFAPEPAEVYPPGFATGIALRGPLVETLEGEVRGPAHFAGVTTVVGKLLNMARPDRAYFGAKDAQQARVVMAMVRDLDIDTTIVLVPTVREADGLAMSSRNRRLDPAARVQAAALFRALTAAVDAAAAGERRTAVLLERTRDVLAAADITPEYVALVDPGSFAPVTDLVELDGRPGILALAATVGGVRLIDNVEVPSSAGPAGSGAGPGSGAVPHTGRGLTGSVVEWSQDRPAGYRS